MKRVSTAVALALALASCGGDTPDSVRILTHDFFAVPDTLLAQFTAETGYEVEVIRGGDAGIVVNQAVLAAGNPVADLLFGVDTTLLSRALGVDLFSPYRSPLLAAVPPALHLTGDAATPIDLGDVCLNYDRKLLADPPASLLDLTDPRFAGMLTVPDPTISTPGLAFMLATIVEFGETGSYTWLDFWADLRSNDVAIAPDWGTAYYGFFSGSGGGDRPIVVSYASSPAAEVLFADPPIDTATTGVIEAGCFRQVEYAGVLRGAANAAGAQAFIDFMLGIPFQESVAPEMFVFPVRPDAGLPQVFLDSTSVPPAPASMDPAVIEEGRDGWLKAWTTVVLR